jgi:hypothetical protein
MAPTIAIIRHTSRNNNRVACWEVRHGSHCNVICRSSLLILCFRGYTLCRNLWKVKLYLMYIFHEILSPFSSLLFSVSQGFPNFPSRGVTFKLSYRLADRMVIMRTIYENLMAIIKNVTKSGLILQTDSHYYSVILFNKSRFLALLLHESSSIITFNCCYCTSHAFVQVPVREAGV